MTEQITFPPVIFGTSCLGNIYQATSFEHKKAIVQACVEASPGMTVFDTAGKYGAGLALQSLAESLKQLGVPPETVVISNKLGWYQTELTTPEPTFEAGIWKDLKHDAVQKISYEGILECFKQGNRLLGDYPSQMVSVHDPDEYLFVANDKADADKRFNDILEAYRALHELKKQGKATTVGIGAKNWETIQHIAKFVELDWIMIANSLTLKSHPRALIEFIKQMAAKGVTVINSAVFNGGFLVGSDHYNYAPVDKNTAAGAELYRWRDQFFKLCAQFNIQPAEACFNFSFRVPGVKSVALSTTRPEKVQSNVDMATREIPAGFWAAMIAAGLLEGSDTFDQSGRI